MDGHIAAINYVLQGVHTGTYGEAPATGHKIEAMSGEFNPEGLMKELITITKLDRVEAEIEGAVTIDAFQAIDTLPNGTASPERLTRLRAAAVMFHRNFNDGRCAELFGVTQRRVSDLVRGKIELFSIDALVNMLVRCRTSGQTLGGSRKAPGRITSL